MTPRDVFEKVKAHLLAQGAKAMATGGGCLYRTSDGRKCAIGCIIADEVYGPEIEGRRLPDKYVQEALRESGIPVPEYSGTAYMLEELQDVHDNSPVSEWADSLDAIERNYFGEGAT